MFIIDFTQKYSGALGFFTSVILVVITGFYAHLTRGILIATANQSRLSLIPVIGIKITKIGISEVFGPGRRNMSVALELTNVGNAPAIEVLIDAEVELRYSKINNESVIPARHDPYAIPFIQPGQIATEANPNFGNVLVTHFFDDVRESVRLNMHRIETDPRRDSYKTSRLNIFVYYRNSLGRCFKSIYSTEIGIFTQIGADPIPKEYEKSNVSQIFLPRPTFHAGIDSKITFEQDLDRRARKRKISGW